MSHISLQPDEVILYEGDVSIGDSLSLDKILTTSSTQVVLTNLRICFVRITKKMFAKEQVAIDGYNIDQIKIYDGVPQVKATKANSCEILINLTPCEIKMMFSTRTEAHKFVNAVYKLVTGKSAVARGAEKIKGAVNIVDDTLGIDTVGTVKNVLENGITRTVWGGLGKKKAENSHSTLGKVVGISKAFLDQHQDHPTEPNEQSAVSCDSQLEMVKKLKDLLDTGVLTQEEFDAKKKEILGL